MFRERPALVAKVPNDGLKFGVPDFRKAHLSSGELTGATRGGPYPPGGVTGHRYQSDFARRYFSQGEAEGEARGEARGEAKAVLAVLDAREINVPDEIRTKIINCTDLDQLGVWIRRAATAHTIEDLDLQFASDHEA
jgi:hypothetical protein